MHFKKIISFSSDFYFNKATFTISFCFRRFNASLLYGKTQGTKKHLTAPNSLLQERRDVSTVLITLIKKRKLPHYFYFMKVCIIIVTSVLQLHSQGTSRRISTVRRLCWGLEGSLGLLYHHAYFNAFYLPGHME